MSFALRLSIQLWEAAARGHTHIRRDKVARSLVRRHLRTICFLAAAVGVVSRTTTARMRQQHEVAIAARRRVVLLAGDLIAAVRRGSPSPPTLVIADAVVSRDE